MIFETPWAVKLRDTLSIDSKSPKLSTKWFCYVLQAFAEASMVCSSEGDLVF